MEIYNSILKKDLVIKRSLQKYRTKDYSETTVLNMLLVLKMVYLKMVIVFSCLLCLYFWG